MSFKAKGVVENKSENFLMGFDLKSNTVKYNLRKKRTDKSPKQYQNEAKKIAPRKSLKKVSSKQNVKKAKQNSEVKNNQLKRCNNPISSFTRSTSLPTLRKRRTCLALEMENCQQQKRSKGWDDFENEIIQDEREDQPSRSQNDRKATPNNVGSSEKTGKKNSKIRNRKSVMSVPSFSDPALDLEDSQATTYQNLQQLNNFQVLCCDQALGQVQSNQSKLIVEKTLAAMKKCKLNYMKQIRVCNANFLDGTLNSNSDFDRLTGSEDSSLNECSSLNSVTPENRFVPLSMKRHTQFTYKKTTIQNRSTTNGKLNDDEEKKHENNVFVELRSSYCIEDSGFLENFTGNQIKESSSNINSTSDNLWECLEKRLQIREDNVDDYSKRPIVHYLKKACDTFEDNKNYLQMEKSAHSSVETTSTDSDIKQICSKKQKKNLEIYRLSPGSNMKNKKQYNRNRLSSEVDDMYDALSVEDSEEELQDEFKHSTPNSKINFSSVHDTLNGSDQTISCAALKHPFLDIPNREIETSNLEIINNNDANKGNGVNSNESGAPKVNGMTIDSKTSKLRKPENEKASSKSSDEVLMETNSSRHKKGTFRGNFLTPSVSGNVNRRRRPQKKPLESSSEDDTFDPSTPKPIRQLRKPKQRISPKIIDTIDLSSASDKEKSEQEKVAITQNGKIQKKKPKEKYKRYVTKLLQREYSTIDSQCSSQAGLAKNMLPESYMSAECTDDPFSISSSDSEVNLKGVGLLCDILDE